MPHMSQSAGIRSYHSFIHSFRCQAILSADGEQDRQGPRLQAASFLLRNIEIIPESAVAVI